MPKSTRTRPTRRPHGALEVELPHPTRVTVATLDDALDRIPGRRSVIRDGVLLLHPAEVDAAVEAITTHMRELVKADRSANAYRDVRLREVRKAITAATGSSRRRPAA